MDWEGNEWADSEWTPAETVKEDVASAFEPLPKGSPTAAVLTPEIDDIHAWEGVLEERSSPGVGAKGEDGLDTAEPVIETTQELQKMDFEESEVEDDVLPTAEALPNSLGLAPPISASSISVDDPHWGSDVEVDPVEDITKAVGETAIEATTTTDTTTTVAETTTTTDTTVDTTVADPQTEPVAPVSPTLPSATVSPVAELQEGWGESDSEPKMESDEEEASVPGDLAKAESPLSMVEDEGWGDGGDGGDWGDFEEGDGFDDPATEDTAPVTVVPSGKKTATVQFAQLEFPQPLEDLVGGLRGSESAPSVADDTVDTPILSYREKSRKLYNSLIRPNCQFIESKRTSRDDTVVKWRGSAFEKALKGEIKKLHENDSQNLKRVFKFGWSNSNGGGAERSGSRGRPLSMPPPKHTESPVQMLSRSSTMSRASTASPAPSSSSSVPGGGGGLTRSSSLRERGRDMTRNKPAGLVQTAIAGAVGQRVASNSPSMSPSMSPTMSPTAASHHQHNHQHHHHALSSVFGSKSKSNSQSHSKSSSIGSITSPLDSPIDSPMDSPLGSPILTNLAPTLSPTLTGTPPSGPSRSATPTQSAPAAAIPEEDSFADFVSASPVVSTHNSPVASPKIGSPAASPLGSKVSSPRVSHPQISSPLAVNGNNLNNNLMGNNDLMGLDMWGSNSTIDPKPAQSVKPSPDTAKPMESPLDDFFGSSATSVNPKPSLDTAKPAESPLDDLFGSSTEKPEPQSATSKPTSTATTGDQLDDFFGSSNSGQSKKDLSGSPSIGTGSTPSAAAHKSSDFDIFNAPKAKTVHPASTGNGSEFDIFNSAPVKQKPQPPAATSGLSGFEIFDKPSSSSTPSIQINSSQAEDDEWGDFTDSVATNNRPRKNSYNSAAATDGVLSTSPNVPSSRVAQSISQSSTQSLFDTTFLDSAPPTRHRSKSPARSPVAPMKLAKKPVAFELDMGPLQPGSKYKQQSEDKLVSDIVSSLPNLDFMASS